MMDPNHLRQCLRTRRKSVSAPERQVAALAVAEHVIGCSVWTKAVCVAGYWACQGELALEPLLKHAWATGKQLYLPIVVDEPPPQSLRFAPYQPDTPLRRNRFNIPEPDVPPATWRLPEQMEVVLTPLVACDGAGTRLGMGGGFYDRSFAFLRDPAYQGARPYLLGVGYEFQRSAVALPRQPWDVPLNALVTEKTLTVFHPSDGFKRI